MSLSIREIAVNGKEGFSFLIESSERLTEKQMVGALAGIKAASVLLPDAPDVSALRTKLLDVERAASNWNEEDVGSIRHEALRDEYVGLQREFNVMAGNYCREIFHPGYMDLYALTLGVIMDAAKNSKWMPPEYVMNDWVADIVTFLREGSSAFLEPGDAPNPAQAALPLDPPELIFTSGQANPINISPLDRRFIAMDAETYVRDGKPDCPHRWFDAMTGRDADGQDVVAEECSTCGAKRDAIVVHDERMYFSGTPAKPTLL